MRPFSVLLLLAWGQVCPPSLLAQRLEPAPYRPWRPQLTGLPQAPTPDTVVATPDLRWDGVILGGVLGTSFGVVFGRTFCGMSDYHGSCVWPTIEGGLIGGIIGVTLGGMIGSIFPEPQADRAAGR